MDKRALHFGALQPGDPVSVPRPRKRRVAGIPADQQPTDGREIAIYLGRDPDTMWDDDGGYVIVQRTNGKLRKWPMWRVRLYIDEKTRRRLKEEELEREAENDGL